MCDTLTFGNKNDILQILERFFGDFAEREKI